MPLLSQAPTVPCGHKRENCLTASTQEDIHVMKCLQRATIGCKVLFYKRKISIMIKKNGKIITLKCCASSDELNCGVGPDHFSAGLPAQTGRGSLEN